MSPACIVQHLNCEKGIYLDDIPPKSNCSLRLYFSQMQKKELLAPCGAVFFLFCLGLK